MALLYDGFMKIQQIIRGGQKFECVVQKDSALVVLVEKSENPLDDLITVGKQFRVGPFVRDQIPEVFSLCGGYIEAGEGPTDAAAREAGEEFGAHGFVDYLGAYTVAPGTSTEVSFVCIMNIMQWMEPTDKTEGITPVKMKLSELLELIDKPRAIFSARFVLGILKYAQFRGVYGVKEKEKPGE